ncbi:neuraminidase-like domain-containing protein [Arthrobacter sp. DNA4]|uniref:neuraminidase-like domain-containing protein n=1 Tax=Arthrobacter sp. DNA4 TaxID=2963432 RepID=UPI0020CBCF42|nr:neuraminidase-like domain-containing protein [Arthrobacter sp. DNA4]UTT71278.1 neuraminidase-like domain-containing protein [Arthrobacter sp. DNA4]
MNRIVPGLEAGSTGAAVADLQQGLLLLLEHGALDLPAPDVDQLTALLKREARRSAYGDGTAKAVSLFQERHRIEAHGSVDDPTAEALNAELERLGAFDEEPTPEQRPTTRTLAGTVLLASGLPASGLALRLYRRGFGGTSTLVTETTTDDAGGYRMQYDPGPRGWSVEVRGVGADGGETVLSTPLDAVSALSSARVDLLAPAGLAPAAGEYRRLLGDIIPLIGDPAALTKASEAPDRRDLTGLATSTGWDARLTALAVNAQRVSERSGLPAEALYGLFRAGIPTDDGSLAQLSPDTVGHALGKLRERGIVDLDDAAVREAVASFQQFADTTRLATPVPGSSGTYGELLGAAADDENAARFARAFFAQTDRAHGGDLWDAARAENVDEPTVARLQWQGKLAYLVSNSAPVTTALMGRLSEGAPGADQTLTSPAALVAEGFYRADQWTQTVRDLAADDAALDALIPASYGGDDVEARLGAYAEDMARKVRISYPTQVVTRMIDAGDLPVGPSAAPTVKLLDALAQTGFQLGAQSVTSYLETSDLASSGLAIAGLGDDERAAATETVKTLHRVYQITPGNDAMAVLLDLGLTSSYDVTSLAYDAFSRLYEKAYLDRFGRKPAAAETRLVWRKAHQVSAMSYNLFGVVKKVDSDPELLAISGGAPARTAEVSRLKESLKGYPTMESLFGSLDFCECEHCRSVLSPAAYLVDLLAFCEGEPAAWANFLAEWEERTGSPYTDKFRNPYDELVARRPDLPQLQLDCANTNTELPYIDLVNEILEYRVAHGALAADAVHDTGDAATESLLAEPANVLTGAYRALREAVYPVGLPFDLWTETVRRFAAHAEAPLAELLDTFRPTDALIDPAAAYDRVAVFAEQLELSAPELALLTDPDPLTAWWTLYGYPDEGAATTAATDPDTGQRIDLNSAKALSRRLGISYRELVDLVQTGFVNPGFAREPLLAALPAAMSTVRWFLDPANQTFLSTESDLLGDGLTAAQQARKKALSVDDWNRLTELAAFAARIDAYASAYGITAQQVRDRLADVPQDQILVLADPDTGADFDRTILQHADGTAADPAVFVRLSWFVRLWRRLGWSIVELDTALGALTPTDADGRLVFADRPLRTAIVYLAHLVSLAATLELPASKRLSLLTLWGPLPVRGARSPYAALFLTRRVAGLDTVFDHPFGDYLAPAWVAAQGEGKPPEFGLIAGHLPAVQGALGLSAAQVAAILADAGTSLDTAPLTLENVSTLARHALLAKAMHRPVDDLIVLSALSALDPFDGVEPGPLDDLAEDHPYSGTLAFVDVAARLAEIDLDVGMLDRLLRGRLDPAGTAGADQPDPARDALLITGLADQLRALRSAAAVPADASAITEQWLAELLGQSLGAPVVARLLKMLRGAEPLTPSTQDFFDTELLQRDLGGGATTGFLAASDYPGLFEPVPGLVAPLPTDTAEQLAEKAAANADLLAAATASRRARTAAAFAEARLRSQATELIAGTLARALDADADLVTALLTDPAVLAVGGRPVLPTLTSLAQSGVDGDFFPSADGTGPRQDTPSLVGDADTAARAATDSAGDPLPAANSMRVTGTLVVDRSGPNRFTIELAKAGASAQLSFPHLSDPLFLDGTAAVDDSVLGTGPDEFVQLDAGVPYRFDVTATQLAGGRARVLVHSAAAPSAPFGSLRLYPASALDQALVTLTRVRSAASLLTALNLDLREARHLLSHPAQFGGLDLGGLPTAPVGDSPAELAAARDRFAAVLRLAGYASLRAELGAGPGELIDVFEAAAAPADPWPHVTELLAALLRRMPDEIAAAALLWPAGPVIDDDLTLRRLWEVLALAARFGTTPDRLRNWTGVVHLTADDTGRAALAADIRETVKANYDDTTWTTAVKPVSDQLRSRQRDALVAFVLHAESLSRVEQLYELLLLDPLSEPVLTTSRIRAALGSVQLFITRILLNLEARVHPSAIVNAEQWEWMKRYRVWEANRKIWLFPENWLEPEFRSDKSHLFTELEGKLLANDVSPEIVEDAFLSYLRQLEELARLDIVAMHLEDDVDFTRNTLHVIGRTFSQPHKYFARRYANRLWSAWEPIDVAIEGNHLMPVVWRDRLFLFWVTFLEQGSPAGAASVDTSKPITLPTVNLTIEAQLHWSELVEGAWSTPRTAGYEVPEDRRLRVTVGAGFSTASIPVWVTVIPDPPLGTETAATLATAGVYLNLGAPFNKALHLTSRNSPPEPTAARPRPSTPFLVGTDPGKVRPTAYIGTSGTLSVSIRTRISSEPAPDLPVTLDVLGATGQYTLLPVNNLITLGVSAEAYEDADDPAAVQAAIAAGIGEIESLMKPAFFADRNTTLFLEPEVTERTIEEWQEWVTTTPVPGSPRPDWLDDDRWWTELVKPRVPKVVPVKPGDWVVDPIDQVFHSGLPYSVLTQPEGRDWITNAGTGLLFDGQVVGERGALDVQLVQAADVASAHGAVTVPVAAGSGLGTDQVLLTTAPAATVDATTLGTGVVLVGAAGLNPTLHGIAGIGSDLLSGAGIFGATR